MLLLEATYNPRFYPLNDAPVSAPAPHAANPPAPRTSIASSSADLLLAGASSAPLPPKPFFLHTHNPSNVQP